MSRSSPRPPTDSRIELRRGRTVPAYTDTFDWVGLSGVAPQAHSAYVKLKIHVNLRRGDARVWPTKITLAEMMGYDKVDTLDPYIEQLERIGAIDVSYEGMPRRCYYTINDLPADAYCVESGYPLLPDGLCRPHSGQDGPCQGRPYDGPLTLKQWYDLHADAIAAREVAAKAKRDAARAKTKAKKAQPAAETPSTGVQDETDTGTRCSGCQGTPCNGCHAPRHTGDHDTRCTGVEQNRSEQDLTNKESAPPPPAPAGPPPDQTREAEDHPRHEPPDSAAANTEVAASLLDDTVLDGIPPTRRPYGKLRARIVAGITEALDAGWPAAQLGKALTAGTWQGVAHVGAVLAARVDDVKTLPPPAPPPAPAPRSPRPACTEPHCDTAHGGPGFIADDNGPVRPCPTCRPTPARERVNAA